MDDLELIKSLRKDYDSGVRFFPVYSRREDDPAVSRCERGVALDLLYFADYTEDGEQHWRYFWTDKARRAWRKYA